MTVPRLDGTVTIDEKTYTYKTTLATSGAYNEVARGADATASRNILVAAVNDSAFARAILTFTSQPNDGDTVTVSPVVYTFKTALSSSPTAKEILRGASAATSRDNLRKAINGNGISGTDYKNISNPHTLVSASNGDPSAPRSRLSPSCSRPARFVCAA